MVSHTPRFGFRQRVEHRSRLRRIPSLAGATIGMTAAALGPVAAGSRDAADTWRDAVDRKRDREDQHRRDDDLSARDRHDGPRRAEREAQRDGRDRGDDANANRRDDARDDSPRRGERQDAADQAADDADTGDVDPRGFAERLRDSVENAAIRRQENAEAFADRQRGRHGDDTASDDDGDGDGDTVSIDLGVDETGTPVLDVAIELPELARRAGVELDLPELSGPIPLDGAADDDADTNDPAASDAAAGGDPAFGYVS